MLLGGADNLAGTDGCHEIEETLRKEGVEISITTYPRATHGWDENSSYRKITESGGANCRFLLKDGGGIRAKTPDQPLLDSLDGKAYLTECMKQPATYVEHNDEATKKGRQAVIDAALKYLR
jgi:dienelactone hydrolase